MAHIKSKDTSLEIKVRKYLFANGFRYRKNDRRYPGTPDLVLPKYRTVIFVNGCFWHRHPGCSLTTQPKTRPEFWNAKFEKNVSNDRKHFEELETAGWHIIVIWQCEFTKEKFETTMTRVMNELQEQLIDRGTTQFR